MRVTRNRNEYKKGSRACMQMNGLLKEGVLCGISVQEKKEGKFVTSGERPGEMRVRNECGRGRASSPIDFAGLVIARSP
jgi:hypothetical protein